MNFRFRFLRLFESCTGMCASLATFSAGWASFLRLPDITSEPVSSFDSGICVLADKEAVEGVQQRVVVEKNGMVW